MNASGHIRHGDCAFFAEVQCHEQIVVAENAPWDADLLIQLLVVEATPCSGELFLGHSRAG